MIEIKLWLFVSMIIGLTGAGIYIDILLRQIKKAKKEIQHREDCTHTG
jgi:hypothetical protein